MTNETLDVIKKRYSAKSYTGEVPTDEQLELIAQAAVQSPSAVNRQPWRVIVVTNPELIAELEEEALNVMASKPETKPLYDRIIGRGGKLFYNAPAIIYLPVPSPASGSEFAAYDVGIVSENIALAATSLGLGNCICAFAKSSLLGEKADYFKERLGFPEGWVFGLSVLVGKSDTEGQPHVPDYSKITYIK